MRFQKCSETCGWHLKRGIWKEPREREMKKWEQKPNLVPVLVSSFLLSVARYPLHLPHCSSIWFDNQQQTLHYPYSCVNYEPLLHTCLTNSLLSSQTIHLEFSTRRKWTSMPTKGSKSRSQSRGTERIWRRYCIRRSRGVVGNAKVAEDSRRKSRNGRLLANCARFEDNWLWWGK